MIILKIVAWIITLIVVVGTIGIASSYWIMTRTIGTEVDRLTAEAASPGGAVITDEQLLGLPTAARRYLVHAGIVGTHIPRLVRLTQKGQIRSSTEANWMGFEADEIYSTNPPAFVWRASFPSPVTPIVLGRDVYLGGKGSILMKMLALVPVADEHGDELAAAGLMRYLNEMMWFPAAFLGSNVTLSAIDDGSFGVSLADRGMVAEAVIFIDAEGRLTNFRARRYNTGSRSVETWETPITAYGIFNGLDLPKAGSAVWKLPGGDLDYIALDITGVQYED